MLEGMMSHYILEVMAGNAPMIRPYGQDNKESDDDNGGPLSGPMTLAWVTLVVVPGKHIVHYVKFSILSQ
jgi:hypothetical protein